MVEYDFLQLASERYSVRKFQNMPIEKSVLNDILKVASVVPTAHNNQPFKIGVVNTPESLEKLRRCTESHHNAPCALIVSENTDESYKRAYDNSPSGEIDCSIVTTHLMLQAFSLGVGSCWVMYFIPEAVIEEFGIFPPYRPVAILLLGYPDENSKPFPSHTKKKPISDIIEYL